MKKDFLTVVDFTTTRGAVNGHEVWGAKSCVK